MKKKIVTVILALALCLSLASWYDAPVAVASSVDDSQWKELYFEVMKSALAYSIAADWESHDFDGKYPLRLEGFLLADLNFDGSPELIMFDLDNRFYDMRIFSIMQNEVEMVFNGIPFANLGDNDNIRLYRKISDDSLTYRIYSLTSTAAIQEIGNIYMTDKATKIDSNFDLSTVVADFMIWTELDDDAYSTDGLRHIFNERLVSEDEYYKLMSSLLNGYEAVNYTPAFMDFNSLAQERNLDWDAVYDSITDSDLQAFLDSYIPEEISVTLDESPMEFDVAPQMINNRVVVPLRRIFEAMGASVQWDNSTKTVTATKGETVVVLKIGDTSPTVNGRVVTIDQPAIIVKGRTLAPLRFVAEAFGGTVIWDGETRVAAITSGE